VILEAQDPASPERLASHYWKPVRNRGRFRTVLKMRPCDPVIDDLRKRSEVERANAEPPDSWPLRAREANALEDWCR
jgi:hypothetical protein